MKINSVKLKNGNVLKMIYLTEQDKENIKNMHSDCNVYSVFDDKKDIEEVKAILKRFKILCENEQDEES